MPRFVSFAGVHLSLLEGWADITDDLAEGTPPTLAKPDGMGALQFSVARYVEGVRPNVDRNGLEALLAEFAHSRALGPASEHENGQAESQFVGATFFQGDDLIRVWYLTNSEDVALVTYVGPADATPATATELAEASAIVHSVAFG